MKNLWNRLMGRSGDAAIKREADEEQMSSAERHFVDESIDGHKADTFVQEHGLLGDRPIDIDDHPPR